MSPASCPAKCGAAGRIYFFTTQTFTVARISGCSFTGISYIPKDFMGSSKIIEFFLISKPSSFKAAAMSVEVTLPYKLSYSWTKTGIVKDKFVNLSLSPSASFITLSDCKIFLCFSCSNFLRLPAVKGTAKPLGIRKLRAKPSFTFTTWPDSPILSIS